MHGGGGGWSPFPLESYLSLQLLLYFSDGPGQGCGQGESGQTCEKYIQNIFFLLKTIFRDNIQHECHKMVSSIYTKIHEIHRGCDQVESEQTCTKIHSKYTNNTLNYKNKIWFQQLQSQRITGMKKKVRNVTFAVRQMRQLFLGD